MCRDDAGDAGLPALGRARSSARTPSSVSTSSSVARIAASESGLPASVPPMPPTSSSQLDAGRAIRSATSAVMPYAPIGTPPPIALPTSRRSGSRPSAPVQPPGPAQSVCVSSMISSVPAARGQLASGGVLAGLRQHDADVGHRRLGQHAGHVAGGQRPLQRRDVVELHDARGRRGGSTGGPMLPRRAATRPSPSSVDERLVDRAVVAAVDRPGPSGRPVTCRASGSRAGWHRSRSA